VLAAAATSAPPVAPACSSVAEAALLVLLEARCRDGPDDRLLPGEQLHRSVADRLEAGRALAPLRLLFPVAGGRAAACCVGWGQLAPLVVGSWGSGEGSQLVVERSRKMLCQACQHGLPGTSWMSPHWCTI
jgi:hypothetical protein